MDARPQEPCACQGEHLTCTSVSTQYSNVSLPIKLKPYALLGTLKTECCGEPIVTLRPNLGVHCGCELTITQTICMRIPVEYGTTADVGEAVATCQRSPNSGQTQSR